MPMRWLCACRSRENRSSSIAAPAPTTPIRPGDTTSEARWPTTRSPSTTRTNRAYGGPFLWLRHAQTRIEAFTSDDMTGVVDAWHDGYGSAAQPLVHRRRVEWHGSARRFLVVDDLRCTGGPHEVAIAWHFDPACRVELDGDVAQVCAAGVRLQLRMSAPSASGAWHLHCGDPDSPLGWHSRRSARAFLRPPSSGAPASPRPPR